MVANFGMLFAYADEVPRSKEGSRKSKNKIYLKRGFTEYA